MKSSINYDSIISRIESEICFEHKKSCVLLFIDNELSLKDTCCENFKSLISDRFGEYLNEEIQLFFQENLKAFQK